MAVVWVAFSLPCREKTLSLLQILTVIRNINHIIFWPDRVRQVKIGLVVAAILIAAMSLVTSHFLVRDLAREERNRMEIWAEAIHSLSTADDQTDLNLVLKVLEENNTIPVIVTDAKGNVQTSRNVEIKAANQSDSMLVAARKAEVMRDGRKAIKVQLTEAPDDYLLVCYDDSLLLTRLSYYPYIQLGIVMLFVVVAIFALLTSKKAEQNKVWVRLSEETAHQLGTPVSSLMTWTEILRESYPDDELIPEMDKDVKRLQLIADRFSKIGSTPERQQVVLAELLGHVVDYMNRRISNKVTITARVDDTAAVVNVNPQLFEWVFENLCKNAVDAMEGRGSISISAVRLEGRMCIDVTDTGKGIERKNIKNVFRPGFTTKKRGWGLGLSLAKRIVEEYHNGSIFVLRSEVGKGTTFRILV